MQYHRVRLAGLACTPPEEVVSSDDLEARLAPVYNRLRLPAGRLELMTGIRARRFYPPGTKPGEISARSANAALDRAERDHGLKRADVAALVHGSVCRDRLEPATACAVHSACDLPNGAGLVLDLSNACLGVLNGLLFVADLIESGRIRAGVAVGTETGRDLVEGTIESLLQDPGASRADVKAAFASLTIGSGSAAVVLCDEELAPNAPKLLGGAVRADTSHAALCTGGDELDARGRPRMTTDSEALLHAGVALARHTWDDFRSQLGWTAETPDHAVTHQVGRAHQKLLFEALGIDPALDHPTVAEHGNTGAAALPTAAAIAADAGAFQRGEKIVWLGIGSGLNCVMLGWEW
ncbi:3-oxoacyl-ACP synthase III [Alienimonas californiensis]|uniref:3-oxoacyl-[acyl-carrier-protein] synthase 3 n=1 Tax=Alienimonas californiensis TaxID=2527989 RepID=A0A517P527_9PLAN|nr:3-oxoacyl-ACP synthase III [Alienimonas californiensis]QDT14445.1 3-oxoacyl-[acyl-carrier-protein] synthase 3 [Alienimonas californiensis]